RSPRAARRQRAAGNLETAARARPPADRGQAPRSRGAARGALGAVGRGRRRGRGRGPGADSGGAARAVPGGQLHREPPRGHRRRAERVSRVVGIDLGTTNSLVAYVKDGVPIVIRDRGGDALVPSVVSVAADGTAYVGREAQRRLLVEPARTAYSV